MQLVNSGGQKAPAGDSLAGGPNLDIFLKKKKKKIVNVKEASFSSLTNGGLPWGPALGLPKLCFFPKQGQNKNSWGLI